MSGVNRLEERVDELIGMASHAGMLGTEAIQAEARADGHPARRLMRRRATEARKAATTAEKLLAKTRERFLREFGAGTGTATTSSQDER